MREPSRGDCVIEVQILVPWGSEHSAHVDAEKFAKVLERSQAFDLGELLVKRTTEFGPEVRAVYSVGDEGVKHYVLGGPAEDDDIDPNREVRLTDYLEDE